MKLTLNHEYAVFKDLKLKSRTFEEAALSRLVLLKYGVGRTPTPTHLKLN